jgi:uncharacterized protein (TIGR00730 family)
MPRKIDPKHFRVTIFGSARIEKGDPRYRLIFTLAKMIAHEGLDLVTGGGPGLMDAASSGHNAGDPDDKLDSIGLGIKLPREQRDSAFLDIKKEFSQFSKRLDTFMKLSNVVVVAPGGIGTLLELFYTWQLMQVKHICETPIILLGPHWPALLEWMKKEILGKKLMSKVDFDFVFTANNCSDAMKIIKRVHADYEAGGHVCKNFTKYKA